jgi:FXSXX-COOH protein
MCRTVLDPLLQVARRTVAARRGRAVIEKNRPPADLETDMIDLTDLSLTDLEDLSQSSLGLALRRVLDQDGGSGGEVVGFQSSI